jgi:hypothetical protein
MHVSRYQERLLFMRSRADHAGLRVRAARRAMWDFVAAVDDLRCLVCHKRIDYDDHRIFEFTSLCELCARAVNED